jgi:hypothetical protein
MGVSAHGGSSERSVRSGKTRRREVRKLDDVEQTIEEARRLMAKGKTRRAAEMLLVAAEDGRGGQLLLVRKLAIAGRNQAGWFGRKPWNRVLQQLDARQSSDQPWPLERPKEDIGWRI